MAHSAVALTIAGSDSSGGAGLQADLKTFEAFGVFGTSAVTLITAQNTVGVDAIEVLAPSLVVAQARAVLDDLAVSAIKLGALGRRDVIEAVADLVSARSPGAVVVDPVMISKHGHPLLDDDAARALAERIVPLATVLTPNRHEAAALTGLAVEEVASAEAAATALRERGPAAVVVTGVATADGRVVDVVATEGGVRRLSVVRVEGNHLHGSGCTFSAAIAAGLARGHVIDEAIDEARAFTVRAMRAAPGLGAGYGPLGHRAAGASRG